MASNKIAESLVQASANSVRDTPCSMQPTSHLRYATKVTEEEHDGRTVRCERIYLQQLWAPWPPPYPGPLLITGASGGDWRDIPMEAGAMIRFEP